MTSSPETTPDDEGLEAMIRQGGMDGADRAMVEILGQEYGGGDYPRMAVANRIWDALRRCGVLVDADLLRRDENARAFDAG